MHMNSEDLYMRFYSYRGLCAPDCSTLNAFSQNDQQGIHNSAHLYFVQT